MSSPKLLSRRATFSMRAPDTNPPFHGDNDSCYLCNPTDLLRYFSSVVCPLRERSAWAPATELSLRRRNMDSCTQALSDPVVHLSSGASPKRDSRLPPFGQAPRDSS